jgi:hypothetical protein
MMTLWKGLTVIGIVDRTLYVLIKLTALIFDQRFTPKLRQTKTLAWRQFNHDHLRSINNC